MRQVTPAPIALLPLANPVPVNPALLLSTVPFTLQKPLVFSCMVSVVPDTGGVELSPVSSFRYSSRLGYPSASASPLPSALLGLKPRGVSQLFGMPSPSVSVGAVPPGTVPTLPEIPLSSSVLIIAPDVPYDL